MVRSSRPFSCSLSNWASPLGDTAGEFGGGWGRGASQDVEAGMPFVRGPYAAPAMLALPAFPAQQGWLRDLAGSVSRGAVQPQSEWEKVGEDTSRTQQALGHASVPTTG